MSNFKKKEVEYSYLANEYYDELSHPTCHNFRTGSKFLIKEVIEGFGINHIKNILEVGSGKSIGYEVLNELKLEWDSFIISDNSKEMLSYSESYFSDDNKVYPVISEAEKMKFANHSFDMIISSLGDPYNTLNFWREVKRVLRPNGICIFTTPSFEWSDSFRTDTLEVHKAEFKINNHEIVTVPSFIFNTINQIDLIKKADLNCTDVTNYRLNQLSEDNVSNKLFTSIGDSISIVTCYLVKLTST